MIRVLSELLWAFRREGLAISTAQALDAARVVVLIGWDSAPLLREGLRAVVQQRAADRARFDACFDAFFATDRAHPGDLWARLRHRGFDDDELRALRDLLTAAAERSGESGDAPALRALLGHPAELDHLLAAAKIRRTLASRRSPAMAGYFAHEIGKDIDLPRAASALDRARRVLIESLGDDRGAALAAALAEELEAIRRRVRHHVERALAPDSLDVPDTEGSEREPRDRALSALDPDEALAVRRAIRLLGEKLRGAERVRAKRARRGRVDTRRTTRLAARTFGIPIVIARKKRRRDKPRLVVVCDVSESVRAASRFMLEFVASAQELFAGTRSFVFVSDLAETTSLFADRGVDRALSAIASGAVVSTAANSNYERALHTLDQVLSRSLDRRTTVVFLGDGRTNHKPHAAAVVERLRGRARAVLWLCPESPASWGLGDSAMPAYARASSAVLAVRTARELEVAARRILALR